MYLTEVHVRNIRALKDVRWRPTGASAGWHVIVGDNGSGKTSFLRAIGFALLGPADAGRVDLNWQRWLRTGTKTGNITVTIQGEPGYDRLSRARPGDQGDKIVASLQISLHRSSAQLAKGESESNAQRSVWNTDLDRGWFCSSFGALRRFSGNDRAIAELYEGSPRIARQTSLFFENVSLESTYLWLRRTLDPRNAEEEAAMNVGRFLTQRGLFHDDFRFIGLNPDGELCFVRGDEAPVLFQTISDGYKAYFGLLASLIRNMVEAYGSAAIFNRNATRVEVPGVVLIDEIDVHMHPNWQRHVGITLTKLMPKIQWIVSSHSPFVCQAASQGSIFRVSVSDGVSIGEMVVGDEFKELVYGTAGDALATLAFGSVETRSDDGVGMLEELAALNNLEFERPLTAAEGSRRTELRRLLPKDAYVLSVGQGV